LKARARAAIASTGYKDGAADWKIRSIRRSSRKGDFRVESGYRAGLDLL